MTDPNRYRDPLSGEAQADLDTQLPFSGMPNADGVAVPQQEQKENSDIKALHHAEAQMYDEQQEQDDGADQLAAMRRASSITPEYAAYCDKLSADLDVPFNAVAHDKEAARKEADVPAWQQIARFAPKTSALLQEKPEVFHQVQDDAAALKDLEVFKSELKKNGVTDDEYNAATKTIFDPAESIKAELNKSLETGTPYVMPSRQNSAFFTNLDALGTQFNESAIQSDIGMRSLFNDMQESLGVISHDEALANRDNLTLEYKDSALRSSEATPNFSNSLLPKASEFVFGGASSLVQSAPVMAVGLLNPLAGVLVAGAQTTTTAYPKYSSRGGSKAEALLGAGTDGLIEVVTEKIPLGFAAEHLGKMSIKNFAKQFLGREMIGEQLATFGQDLTDTLIANPNKTMAEFWQERPEAAVQTMFAVGMNTAAMASIQHIANTVMKYDGSYEANQKLNQEMEIVKKLKVAGLNTIRAKQILDNMDGDSPQDVYVDPQQLFNQGEISPQQFKNAMPNYSTQLDEALAVGGLLRMDKNELMLAMRNDEEGWASLSQHLKVDPAADSLYESAQSRDALIDELNKLADKRIAESKNEAAARDQWDALKEKARQRLADSGMDKEAIEQAATMDASVAHAFSTRTGLDAGDILSGQFGTVSRRLSGGEILGGVFNQYAGEQAQGADLTALQRAKQAVDSGADPEQTRQETGWHKWEDGKWRFEIDDSQAKQKLFSDKGYFGEQFKRHVLNEGDKPDGYSSLKVGDILDHSALFGAYPNLADIRIVPEEGMGASFSSGEGDPVIGIGTDKPMKDVKSAILHEIQHAIQEQEGFARGGSAKSFYRPGERNKHIEDLFQKYKADEYSKKYTDDELYQKAERVVDSQPFREKAYRRLAGEIEARDTQARAGMSAEERKLNKPYISQGIPDDQVIVRKGDGGLRSNAENDAAKYNTDAAPTELSDEAADDLVTLYQELGSDDDNFQYARKIGDDLDADIISALPEGTVQTADEAVILAAQMDAEDAGAPDIVDVKKYSIPTKELLVDANDKPILKDGKKQYATQKRDAYVYINDAGEYWTDLSDLKRAGGVGGIIYTKVADFAEKNGGVFRGDPLGLSDDALLKRTEHMASGIARRKDTGRFIPHERQLTLVDKDHATSPLNTRARAMKWVKGNDTINRREIVKTAFHNITQVMPELRHAWIDPDTGRILVRGTPLNTKFRDWVHELQKSGLSSDGQRRTDTAGAVAEQGEPLGAYRHLYASASIKRQLLANTLARYVGESAERRRQILDRLGEISKDLESYDGRKLFYQSKKTESFDGSNPNIFKQNDTSPRGFFDPSTRDITMLPTSDLSTYLHESGHLYLEVMASLAAHETASEGLRADMDAALKWFGVKGENASERLAAWNAMTLEEKRNFHEKWAESFEQYLFEGVAPSPELREAFKNFRQWLTHVYKSMAQFLVGQKNAKLNDEMRGVFDRILASEEQINTMREARNMLPLFTVRPANITNDEWERHQKAAKDFVEGSIEQLTSRSLRDMKWLSNAKNKTLRKLQREAAHARRESRMEARTAVLGQPVYRAWQFLTAPVEGVVARNKRAKSNEHVDTARDSLFTAIAKLGGLNKEEAVSQYGLDPKDFLRKGGVFGKPVLRVDGGLSPDAMAEALSQFNYLPLDEHGKWDILDLEDLLREEAAGNPQYSTDVDMDVLLGEPQRAFFDAENVEYMGGRLNRIDIRNMFDDIQLAEMAGIDPFTGEKVADMSGQLQQPAFHGSPYKFDKFSLEHIGKGEGAQAYGWGLYFAGSKDVAEFYRKELSDFYIDGKRFKETNRNISKIVKDNKDDLSVAAKKLRQYASENAGNPYAMIDEAIKVADAIESGAFSNNEDGQLYKVEIPEDSTYLLWDKPLSEQPEKVLVALGVKDSKKVADLKKQLKKAAGNVFNGGDDISGLFSDNEHTAEMDRISLLIQQEPKGVLRDRGFDEAQIAKMIRDDVSGESLYTWISGIKGQEYGSKILHSYGLNGIKYLDGSSRGAGDGNYNYVIFDDSAVKILETYYQLGDKDQPQSRTLESMGVLSDDGIHPDLLADAFGFPSTEAMIKSLLTAPDPLSEINRLTDEIMVQRHADLATPQAIEQAALAALHSEAHSKFLATELAILNRAAGKPRFVMQAAKQYADRIVSALRIADLNPAQYEMQAAKAGKETEKLLGQNKTADAAMAKRNQILHDATARRVREEKESVAKALRFFDRTEKAARNGKLRADVGAQVLTLLDTYDLRKGTTLKAAELADRSLAEFVQQQSEAMDMPMPSLADAVLRGGVKRSYKTMSVEEFNGLVDAVKYLEAVGRREYAMYKAVRDQSFAQERSAILDRLREYWPDAFDEEGNPLPTENAILKTGAYNTKKKARSAVHELLTPETVTNILEGGEFGQVHDSLFARLSNAMTDRSILMKELHEKLQPFMDAYTWKERREFGKKDIGTAAIGEPLSRENALVAALLAGSKEGRDRLANYGWNDARIAQVVNLLDAKDIALANAIFDMFDNTLWPKLEALNKRTMGVSPPKVLPIALQAKNGTLTGGYFPIRYDGDMDARSSSFDDKQALDLMKNGIGLSAKTNQSSSQARVDGVKMRPLLSLSVMSKVAGETAHDISLREAVMDSARLLNNAEIAQGIQNIVGMEGWKSLKKNLGDIASPPHDAGGIFAGAANFARRNVVTALMSGVGTAVQNFTGLLPAFSRVHKGLLLKEIADVPHLIEKYKDTIEKSAYMRERFGQFERDLVNDVDKLGMKKGLMPDQSVWFAMMAWVDRAVSVPVWQAAYREGAAKGVDAVEYADHIVRQTQGGGRLIDRAPIMRGGALQQLFTMFYSYFNGQLNLVARDAALAKREVAQGEVSKAAARLAASAIFVWILPAVVTELTRQAPDDEDDEEKLQRVVRATILYPTAMIPLLRDFAPFVYDKVAGNRAFDPRLTPVQGFVSTLSRAATAAGDIGSDDFDEKDFKALMMGVGFTFNLPAILFTDVVLGTKALLNGETDDIRAPLIGTAPSR